LDVILALTTWTKNTEWRWRCYFFKFFTFFESKSGSIFSKFTKL